MSGFKRPNWPGGGEIQNNLLSSMLEPSPLGTRTIPQSQYALVTSATVAEVFYMDGKRDFMSQWPPTSRLQRSFFASPHSPDTLRYHLTS